jgi:hypothetical protein
MRCQGATAAGAPYPHTAWARLGDDYGVTSGRWQGRSAASSLLDAARCRADLRSSGEAEPFAIQAGLNGTVRLAWSVSVCPGTI